MATTYTIRYRRPDAPWSVVVMVVPNGADDAIAQTNRLITLGYSIVDVSPSLPEATPRSTVQRLKPESIANDIRNLGISPGSCVMVHASLRAIGPVEDGAQGVLDAIETAIGPNGGLLMLLGAKNDWDWVNGRPEEDRAGLLRDAEPFDPLTTPADPDVGYLAEALRQRPGTQVTDNPEGRFAARGALASQLLADAPWDDYFGPGSPLDHLCRMGGGVLRLGADPDTTSLLHWSEYLAPLPSKRRARRHRRVVSPHGPVIRTVECLDDSDGIVDWPGEDYFKSILDCYVRDGRARVDLVGRAESQFLDANDFAAFGASWMVEHFG